MAKLFFKYIISMVVLVAILTGGFAQQDSSADEAQLERSRQFAAYIDSIWDLAPSEGEAQLKFVFTKAGEVYNGVIDVTTEFNFVARDSQGYNYFTGLTPNENGRWLYQDLEPSTYRILITGTDDKQFADFEWTLDEIVLESGDAPVFEIELEPDGVEPEPDNTESESDETKSESQ